MTEDTANTENRSNRDERRRHGRQSGTRMKLARAVVAVVLASWAVPGPAPAASTLSQLGGVQELKSWFNASAGHPRLIFLLSPT